MSKIKGQKSPTKTTTADWTQPITDLPIDLPNCPSLIRILPGLGSVPQAECGLWGRVPHSKQM